jgi:phenylpyruvate tautomerase PptA (4-oxalocrotonate tautomerase family)
MLDNHSGVLWDHIMPLANICLPEGFETAQLDQVSRSISQILSTALKKSEDYIMTVFQETKYQSFANNHTDPTAYVEIKNVGELTSDLTSVLAAKLTETFHSTLNIPPSRIYIEFQQSERHLWGWNGKTFHS